MQLFKNTIKQVNHQQTGKKEKQRHVSSQLLAGPPPAWEAGRSPGPVLPAGSAPDMSPFAARVGVDRPL